MAQVAQPASEHLKNALQSLQAEITLRFGVRTTTTHGSNADCPNVRSGEWRYCIGHEALDDELITLLTGVRDSVQAALDAIEVVKQPGAGAYRVALQVKKLL